jgi:hypothetical protein
MLPVGGEVNSANLDTGGCEEHHKKDLKLLESNASERLARCRGRMGYPRVTPASG